MVDFNNESTVATPPGDVVKIIVLERREQVIEALEAYYNIESAELDTSHKVSVLRARVMAFWYQIQAMAKRRLPGKDYQEIMDDMLEAKSADDLITAFEWMNTFVDDLGLTYIDSRERYDRRRVEDANTKKGL